MKLIYKKKRQQFDYAKQNGNSFEATLNKLLPARLIQPVGSCQSVHCFTLSPLPHHLDPHPCVRPCVTQSLSASGREWLHWPAIDMAVNYILIKTQREKKLPRTAECGLNGSYQRQRPCNRLTCHTPHRVASAKACYLPHTRTAPANSVVYRRVKS